MRTIRQLAGPVFVFAGVDALRDPEDLPADHAALRPGAGGDGLRQRRGRDRRRRGPDAASARGGPPGWWLIATLIAVFPANLHMALHPEEFTQGPRRRHRRCGRGCRCRASSSPGCSARCAASAGRRGLARLAARPLRTLPLVSTSSTSCCPRPRGCGPSRSPAGPGSRTARPRAGCGLDALACWLQDVAYADVEDAGLERAAVWVVRRTRIRVNRFPRFGEGFELTTFCSGLGRMWAERRTDVRSTRGRASRGAPDVEAVSLWVHLDVEHWRPTPLSAARARGLRRRSPRPPRERSAAPPRRRRSSPTAPSTGPFAPPSATSPTTSTTPPTGTPLEEELLAGPDPVGIDAELEYRTPVAAGPQAVSAPRRAAAGSSARTASCTPRSRSTAPGRRWRLTPRRSCGRARRPLVIGMGGGGDVVGALASAELARIYDGAEPARGRPELGATPDRSRRRGRGAWTRSREPRWWLPACCWPGRGPGCAVATCTSRESRMARSWPDRRCCVTIDGGPAAIAAGLAAALTALDGDLLLFVDVGGDVLAHGDEPGLRSPLCDAMLLAAAQQLGAAGAPVLLGLFGSGCDSELTNERGPGAARRRGRRRRPVRRARPHRGRRRPARGGDRARADRGQRPGGPRLPR